jgi:hypothetical protein
MNHNEQRADHPAHMPPASNRYRYEIAKPNIGAGMNYVAPFSSALFSVNHPNSSELRRKYIPEKMPIAVPRLCPGVEIPPQLTLSVILPVNS